MTTVWSRAARRHAAAFTAALSIVAVSLIGGAALSAEAAVSGVTLDGQSPMYAQYPGAATFSGTVSDADQGDHVVVITVGGNQWCSDGVTADDYTGATAPWSCGNPEPTLGAGTYSVVATVYDPSDIYFADPLVSSAPLTLIVYENSVGTVDSQTTSTHTPYFAVEGPRMGTVAIELDDGTQLCVAEIFADMTSWGCSSTVELPVGNHQVWPHTRLANGADLGRGTPASLEIVAPSAPTIKLSYTGDDVTASDFVWPSGDTIETVAVDRVVVKVSTDGGLEQPYCSAQGGDGGLGETWSCDYPPEGVLGLGTNLLRAYAISTGGIESAASTPVQVIRVSRPVITAPESGYTNTPAVDLAGSFADYARFPDGYHFTFFAWYSGEGQSVLCEGDTTAQTFGCPATVPDDVNAVFLVIEPDEVHSFSSEDHFLTLDTEAPAPPAITAPGEVGQSGMREFAGPLTTISGTGEPGAVITLSADGSPVACANAPVTVQWVDLGDGMWAEEGPWSCTLASAPTPGIHRYSAIQTDEALNPSEPSSESGQLRATIPVPAPGLAGSQNTRAQAGTPFSLSGSKTPGATVVVTIIVPGRPDVRFAPCQTTAGNAASWSCDYSTSGLAPGSYALSVVQVFDGVASPELTPRPTLTITAAPAIVRPDSPLAAPTASAPLTWTLVISGVNGPLRPGQSVGLSSSGLPPGSTIDAELHSTPRHLGTTTVRPDGTFSFTVTIPRDAEPGEHRIVAILTVPGDEPSIVESPVAIELEPDEEPAGADSAENPRRVGLADTDRNTPGAPTSLSGSVPTLRDLIANPGAIALSAGLALAILLLVAIPAEILNSTIESNTNRFGRFFGRVQRGVDGAAAWLSRVTRTRASAAAVLVLLTSIIFGFVDPGFGFDLASLRLVLSLAIALFFVTYVAAKITGSIASRAWGVEHEIGMQPAAILFAVVGVIIARVLDFSPGFLVGLVIGLELAQNATLLHRTRSIVLKFGVIVGMGILAWLGYSLAIASRGAAPATTGSALLEDTLIAITTEGLTAVMVAALPVAFLDGKKIFDRSRRLWALTFAVIATVFSLLVLPTALAGQEISNIGWWVAILAAFAVITLGVTFWLRASSPRPADDTDERDRETVSSSSA